MINFPDKKINGIEHQEQYGHDPIVELNKNRKAAGLPSSIAFCEWLLTIGIGNTYPNLVSDNIMKSAAKTLSKY